MINGIIDLHTHTFFSDGELSPAELVQRAAYAGYGAIGITDHADSSNIDFVLDCIIRFVADTQKYLGILVLPGIELTHVPPGQIGRLVAHARERGAKLVVLHGETICEPVPHGTNLAGIEAGVDILAHPGLLTIEEAELASKKGVHLEISARFAHGLANGRVCALARAAKAKLVLDTDTHSPGNLFSIEWRKKVAFGAGLTEAELDAIDSNMQAIVRNHTGKEYPA
jgi:histidinol phosphatase-like PHP family hydrolase